MLIDKVKLKLRIKNDKFDLEIADLIEAAKLDLKITGVNKFSDTDPLIMQAIKFYCEANFGEANQDTIRCQAAYDSLKIHLALCGEYK